MKSKKRDQQIEIKIESKIDVASIVATGISICSIALALGFVFIGFQLR